MYGTGEFPAEGDPVHLMKLRQRTFEHTSKLIMECSSTIAGFDEAWFREMKAEKKGIVFRGGIQKTVSAEYPPPSLTTPGILPV